MRIQWNKVTWYSKLLAVILFVTVLILGVYIGVQYQIVNDSSSINIGDGKVSINSNILNWKVYRNKEYGFEFHYPKEWAERSWQCAPCTAGVVFYSKASLSETDPFRKSEIVPEVTVSYYNGETDTEALLKKLFPSLKKYTTIEKSVNSVGGEIDVYAYGKKSINGKNVSYILLGAESASYFYFIPSNKKRGLIVFSAPYITITKNPNLISTIIF